MGFTQKLPPIYITCTRNLIVFFFLSLSTTSANNYRRKCTQRIGVFLLCLKHKPGQNNTNGNSIFSAESQWCTIGQRSKLISRFCISFNFPPVQYDQVKKVKILFWGRMYQRSQYKYKVIYKQIMIFVLSLFQRSALGVYCSY